MSLSSTTSASIDAPPSPAALQPTPTPTPKAKRERKPRRELVLACLRATRGQALACYQADWLLNHLPAKFKQVDREIIQGIASNLFEALNQQVTSDRRWQGFCALGLRPAMGKRAWEAKVQRRSMHRIEAYRDRLALSWAGRQKWQPPMRASFARLEKTWMHQRFNSLECMGPALLRLAGWKLCRESGLPGYLPCFRIRVNDDACKSVFKRLNGHARGWDAYKVFYITGSSHVMVNDMGQYSGSCTYHRFDRRLFIQNYAVVHENGRSLLWMFDGQLYQNRLPRGYRWVDRPESDLQQAFLELHGGPSKKSICIRTFKNPADISEKAILNTIRQHATATLCMGTTAAATP